MSIDKALIIGGGISGLTAAAALGRQGVDIEVVEIKDRIGDLGGVGLSIMGNATKALAMLGAAEACVKAGMPADDITVRSQSGDVVGTLLWPPLGKPGWPNQIGITRADFHSILSQAASAAGAKFFCGVTARSIEQDSEGAHVVFTDGRVGHYDLVVGADGIYSATRKSIFPEADGPQETGLAIWRAYAPRPEGVTTTQLHFDGPHGVVGICPINEHDCYVYCVHKADRDEWREPSTLHDQYREILKDYGGLIPALTAQMTDPSLVSYRPIEWFLLPAPWYQGRVVLIGDAAHTNPPNIAQGAAMGIEDAIVLAGEVSKPGSVEDALVRFMERRWDRTKLVVEASCNVARGQAEHIPGFDAASEMRRVSAALAEPFW